MILSRTRALAALLLAGCAAPGAAGAASLPADTTAIVSGDAAMTAALPTPAGDSWIEPQSVSQDGRHVVFTSRADGVSDEDDDSRPITHVYVKDRVSGAVTLVSRRDGPSGEVAADDCEAGVISDDGRRVAFVCRGALVADDLNDTYDVYVRDLPAAATRLVSRSAQGVVGDDKSQSPSIDEDGSRIAFTSKAGNLGADNRNHVELVWAADLPPIVSGTPSVPFVVSRATGFAGALPTRSAERPSIDDSGEHVAFQSNDATLVPTADDGVEDVFVRDLAAGTTELVSRRDGDAGALGDGDSGRPAISGNAAVVAFLSEARNLSPLDPDDERNVYRRSLVVDTTRLVDQKGGAKANGDAESVAIDDNGSVIAFGSYATNLDPADPNPGPDVYLALGAADVRLASPGDRAPASGAWRAGVSGEGRHVAMSSSNSLAGAALPAVNDVALLNRDSGAIEAVARPAGPGPFENTGGHGWDASVSADGRRVAFLSTAPALGVPAAGLYGVVVRDVVTGASVLASRADGAGGAPFDDVEAPALSADGRRVAFVVREGGRETVWVRDLETARTLLVSRADGPGGAAADDDARAPAISGDGARVAFTTTATNLGDGDADAFPDVHVRDLAAGRTLLATRADGPAGAKADQGGDTPAISADGARIAFTTTATNLGDGDADAFPDVHVRDLAAGRTVLVSRADGAAGAKAVVAGMPSISADGTRIAFLARGDELGSRPPPTAHERVWVRDLAAATTVLASRGDGAAGPLHEHGAAAPRLSADGRVVAYTTTLAGQAPGVPFATQILRRDLAAQTTTLVSRGTGAAGAPTADGGFEPTITADGACVAFTSRGDLLGPPGSREYDQVFLRVLTPDCGRPGEDGGGGDDGGGGGSGGGQGGGGGGGGGAGRPPAARDTTAPRLSAVSLTPARFRATSGRDGAASRPPARRAAPIGRDGAASRRGRRPSATGATVRFTSSDAGQLTLAIERRVPGRTVRRGRGRVCAPVRRAPRRGGCTAYAGVATLMRTIAAGRGSFALSGRIGRRALRPGAYRLTLVAHDAAGNRSAPVSRTFTILGASRAARRGRR